MAKISKKYQIIFCVTTGILIGIVVGSLVVTILMSYRIDNYQMLIRKQENELADKISRLEKLEESLNNLSSQKYILKDIVINIIYDGEEFDKINFQKYIEEKYKHLLGKEVASIDPETIAEIVDKRIFKLSDNDYKLHIEKVFVAEVMKIWVRIVQF